MPCLAPSPPPPASVPLPSPALTKKLKALFDLRYYMHATVRSATHLHVALEQESCYRGMPLQGCVVAQCGRRCYAALSFQFPLDHRLSRNMGIYDAQLGKKLKWSLAILAIDRCQTVYQRASNMLCTAWIFFHLIHNYIPLNPLNHSSPPFVPPICSCVLTLLSLTCPRAAYLESRWKKLFGHVLFSRG